MENLIKQWKDKCVSVAGIVSLLQQNGMQGEFRNYQALKKYVEQVINKLNNRGECK
jgi:hypothetical protein